MSSVITFKEYTSAQIILAIIKSIFSLQMVSCNYPDYVNFNEQQNKKSYANQDELFPCCKLYEFVSTH